MIDKALAVIQWTLIVCGVVASQFGLVSIDRGMMLMSVAMIAAGGIPIPIWRIARLTR